MSHCCSIACNLTRFTSKFGGKHILILVPDHTTSTALCQPRGAYRRSHPLALLDGWTAGNFLPTEARRHNATREVDTDGGRPGERASHGHGLPIPVVLGSGPSTARDWSLKEVVLAAASETVKGGSSRIPPAGPRRGGRGAPTVGRPALPVGLHRCRLVADVPRPRPALFLLLRCLGASACHFPLSQQGNAVAVGVALRRGAHRQWQQVQRHRRWRSAGPLCAHPPVF